MDTQRLILFVVFSFSLLLLWEAWQKQLNPPTPRTATEQATTPIPSSSVEGPGVKGAAVPGSSSTASRAGPREHLRVSTDTLLAEIDTQGGDIVYLELLKQKDTHEATKNFVLFGPEHRYAAQSGLLGAGLPNHKTLFQAEGREFDLAQGQDKLEVRLRASTPEGIKVSKILTFYRASYRIDVAEDIANGSSKPLA